MRRLLLLLPLALVGALAAVPTAPEREVGLGFVTVVDFDQTLRFYASPEDVAPLHTVALTSTGEIPTPTWLLPESWWTDYFVLVFRVMEVREGWARVVVHEDTGPTLWLQTDARGLPFEPWEVFLTSRLTLAQRLDPEANPILSAPSPEAPLAEVLAFVAGEDWIGDCLVPVEVQGEWARVAPSNLCRANWTEPAEPLGWIRWRDDDTLLVRYSFSC